MSQRIPCIEYDASKNQCKSGFPVIHSACWGGYQGCPTCKNSDRSGPLCMQEDPPAHLMRADGYPMHWPVEAKQ
jgi:hypothetical protein